MHRKWASDDDQMIPYSDPGLQAAYRARTVQIVKRVMEDDVSVAVAADTMLARKL
jgi:hypothetical protein